MRYLSIFKSIFFDDLYIEKIRFTTSLSMYIFFWRYFIWGTLFVHWIVRENNLPSSIFVVYLAFLFVLTSIVFLKFDFLIKKIEIPFNDFRRCRFLNFYFLPMISGIVGGVFGGYAVAFALVILVNALIRLLWHIVFIYFRYGLKKKRIHMLCYQYKRGVYFVELPF